MAARTTKKATITTAMISPVPIVSTPASGDDLVNDGGKDPREHALERDDQ